MREILGLGEEAPLHRRWFHDEYFDLFVWQDAGGALARFELCYGAGAAERALVWLGGEPAQARDLRLQPHPPSLGRPPARRASSRSTRPWRSRSMP